jgi:hypothetical protein
LGAHLGAPTEYTLDWLRMLPSDTAKIKCDSVTSSWQEVFLRRASLATDVYPCIGGSAPRWRATLRGR